MGKQYLDICRMHDDRVGESAARAALAQAYEAIGNTAEAIKQLENLLNVASEGGELKAQASACLNLGILYNGPGETVGRQESDRLCACRLGYGARTWQIEVVHR